jgi:hypothetical protein
LNTPSDGKNNRHRLGDLKINIACDLLGPCSTWSNVSHRCTAEVLKLLAPRGKFIISRADMQPEIGEVRYGFDSDGRLSSSSLDQKLIQFLQCMRVELDDDLVRKCNAQGITYNMIGNSDVSYFAPEQLAGMFSLLSEQEVLSATKLISLGILHIFEKG